MKTFEQFLKEALYHDKQSARDYETLQGYGASEETKPKDINDLKSSDYIFTIADDRDNFQGIIAFSSEKEADKARDRIGQILDQFDLPGNSDDYTFDVDKVGDWKKTYGSVRMPSWGFDYRD